MKTSKISVLLPLYNENLNYAQLAIESIINQTYNDLEIILLLDNPNNSELKNLLYKYEKIDTRIKIDINEKNLGLPETLNIGIKLATGKYIARMDGDDISETKRLKVQLDFMLNNPNIDLVGSDARIIDENNNIIGEYHKLRTDLSQKMMLRYFTINLIHPSWLGKAQLFKSLLYRNFSHCEDYDFMLRAYSKGYKFYNLPECLLSYRILQQSIDSISRKYAYEQYINTLRARKQFQEYSKFKYEVYPDLPQLTYNSGDKEKYQSILFQLNELRTAYKQRNIFKCISLFIKISLKDKRPLSFRIKGMLLYKLLQSLEFLKSKLKF